MNNYILPVISTTSIMFFLAISGNQNSKNMIKVTTLIENTCIADRDDLISEHGISIHIKFEDTNILFDTGSSDNFINNAQRVQLLRCLMI